MRCSLCLVSVNGLGELKDGNEKTLFSRKSICTILKYLAKTAKPPIDEERTRSYDRICNICVDDILTYDEYMVKLLQIQERILSSMRNEPLEEFIDNDIKFEYIANENGGNVIYFDELKTQTINEGESFENVEYESELVETLKESATSEHVDTEQKPLKKWQCEICGITKKDEEYLELHMNVHEGKSDLECRYCDKRYTRKIHVIRHMHKHWDKKKFQCERCGLRFNEESIYYNHRLQHEAEEDPLICNVCNQSFKTRRTYRNHLWVHREDRPRFSCEICGKKFVEKYTLKVHLRCHSEQEEPHSARRRKVVNNL